MAEVEQTERVRTQAQPFTSTVVHVITSNYPEQGPHHSQVFHPPWLYPRSPSITRFGRKVAIFERRSEISSPKHSSSTLLPSYNKIKQSFRRLLKALASPLHLLGGCRRQAATGWLLFPPLGFTAGLSHHPNMHGKQDFQGHSASLQLQDFTLTDFPHVLLSCSVSRYI